MWCHCWGTYLHHFGVLYYAGGYKTNLGMNINGANKCEWHPPLVVKNTLRILGKGDMLLIKWWMCISYTTRWRSLRDLHHRGLQARGGVRSIETEPRCVTDLYHGESARAETNVDQSVRSCICSAYQHNFCAYVNKRRFDTDSGGQIGCAPFTVRWEPIRFFTVRWSCGYGSRRRYSPPS